MNSPSEPKLPPLLTPIAGLALEMQADGTLVVLQRFRLLGPGLARLESPELPLATNSAALVTPAGDEVELPEGLVIDHSQFGLRLSQGFQTELEAREVRFLDREERVRFVGKVPVTVARATRISALRRKDAACEERVAA